jgi:hypothetical protein
VMMSEFPPKIQRVNIASCIFFQKEKKNVE